MPTKTRYKGIYKKENGSYFFNYRIKLEDGTYKNICRQGKSASELNELKCRLKIEGLTALDGSLPDYDEKDLLMRDVCEDYLSSYSLKVKKSSYNSAVTIINKYILFYFDNLYIKQAVKLNTLKKWKTTILEMDNILDKRKNRIFAMFKEIINRSFLLGKITQEEYGKVQLTLETIKDDTSVYESRVDFFTLDEFNKFITSIPDNSVWKTFFWLLYYSGMRIGEVLALTPKDINFKKRTININKQLVKENIITTPKSKLGIREILLDFKTCNILQQYLKENPTNYKSQIFTLSRTEIRRKKELYCQLAEVKTIRIHDFRHSHVSLLINKYLENNLAIDFLTIAKRMGHSVQETMDTYAHMYPSTQKNIVDLL